MGGGMSAARRKLRSSVHVSKEGGGTWACLGHHVKQRLGISRNGRDFFVEANFPRLFYWLKKRAILYVVRRKASLATT
jgi:hypothetical protein